MSNNTMNTENDMTDTEAQDLEQELESTEEIAADSESAPNEVEKPKAAPAYEAFLAAVRAHAGALGLVQKDQKGFFQFANATTGHKLYVAKQGKQVTRIDTTLPMDVLGGISYGLEKPNGRIVCHVEASVEACSLALDALASYGEKIPAPKRQPKAEAQSAQ